VICISAREPVARIGGDPDQPADSDHSKDADNRHRRGKYVHAVGKQLDAVVDLLQKEFRTRSRHVLHGGRVFDDSAPIPPRPPAPAPAVDPA
jgi:hypothetical protein